MKNDCWLDAFIRSVHTSCRSFRVVLFLFLAYVSNMKKTLDVYDQQFEVLFNSGRPWDLF